MRRSRCGRRLRNRSRGRCRHLRMVSGSSWQIATQANAKRFPFDLELSQPIVTHQGYEFANLIHVHRRNRIRWLAPRTTATVWWFRLFFGCCHLLSHKKTQKPCQLLCFLVAPFYSSVASASVAASVAVSVSFALPRP